MIRLTILLLLLSTISVGQTSRRYWVRFDNKLSTPYNISNPEDFLSDDAINRRVKQGISLDSRDLPVDPVYIQVLNDLPSVSVKHTSKWFNAASIEATDSTIIDSIFSLSFVLDVDTVKFIKTELEKLEDKSLGHTNFHHEYYGGAFRQIEMLNGHFLHSLGFDGQGMTIAVLDAGFDNVDEVDVFSSMVAEGRILATKDFVDGDNNVFEHHQHGTAVLSTMGANTPGRMIGTAPGANYILIRSEDGGSESKVEEDNWIAGAEYADSIGADIFNTSLGYTTFDDSTMNYTYADMDGNTSRISIAADIASSKGILVVTSAGNSGNSSWHYISTPADADSSLTVAAVDSFMVRAIFSSYGPSADGDLKPNVAAMGFRTMCAFPNGDIRTANGTSFSSPVLAGMAACLWQALPILTNMEIKELIENHGHQSSMPDTSLGFGVPNFYEAYLEGVGLSASNSDEFIRIFPTVFKDRLNIHFHSQVPAVWNLSIMNLAGQQVYERELETAANEYVQSTLTDEIVNLRMGTYIVHLVRDGVIYAREKIVKVKD